MKKHRRRLCGTWIKHPPKWSNSYKKLQNRRREFYRSFGEYWGSTWWCRTSAGMYIKLGVREYSVTHEPYAVTTTSIEADVLDVDTRCMRRLGWIWEYHDEYGKRYKCPNCSCGIFVDSRLGRWTPDTCPHCGARVNGDDKSSLMLWNAYA